METIGAAAKAIGGVFLLGIAALLLWKGVSMWADTQSVGAGIGKFFLSILMLVPLLLSFDMGSGLIMQVTEDDSPTLVKLERRTGAPNDLIVLLHGWNGYGSVLANVLRRLADEATVIAFHPSEYGHNKEAVIATTLDTIDELKPERIRVYGESYGGMVTMDLLRAAPKLYLDKVVFNATPGKAAHVQMGGAFLKYLKHYPAGIVSTAALRLNQWKDMRKPQAAPEVGVDLVAMQKADDASLGITGPTAIGDLGYMGGFTEPVPGEFDGRVGSVEYLHAPARSDGGDGMVNVEAASATLREAFGDVFKDVPVPEWTANGNPLHTPTPRRPSPILEALLAA